MKEYSEAEMDEIERRWNETKPKKYRPISEDRCKDTWEYEAQE